MDLAQFPDLGRYYDEYMFGDRKSPQTQQAKFLFKSIAKGIYEKEPDWIRQKFDFDAYIGAVLIPTVLAYLQTQQTEHPTITPERIVPK